MNESPRARLIAYSVAVLAPAAGVEATPVPGAPGCPTFAPNSIWHADVSKMPLDAKSATYVASIGTTAEGALEPRTDAVRSQLRSLWWRAWRMFTSRTQVGCTSSGG